MSDDLGEYGLESTTLLVRKKIAERKLFGSTDNGHDMYALIVVFSKFMCYTFR